MVYKIFFLSILGVVMNFSAFGSSKESKVLVYPKSRQDAQVDVYHGIAVKDPYRYLEDPDKEETKTWVKAQNQLTFDYLSQIPQREKIRKRLESLWNYERYGLVFKKAGRYFFSKNNGLQNQSAVYIFEKLGETPSLLLDPNKLSDNGTVALNFYIPSEDGKLLAYGLSQAGSDWVDIKVLDIETGKELSDHLKWIKFSEVSWLPDSSGFYYSCYEKPEEGVFESLNVNQKIYFHQIGHPQKEDLLVYERPDHKEWFFSSHVTEDGKFLVISVLKGSASENAIFYKKIDEIKTTYELFSKFDAKVKYVGNEENLFWFQTDKGAHKGRIIEVDLNFPEEGNWKELIPESVDTLQDATLIGEQFVLTYLKDVHSQIHFFNLDGSFQKELILPSLGAVRGFSGKKLDFETFYIFTSFTSPETVYRYDFESKKSEIFFQPTFPLSLKEFEIKQVFYSSLDGTKIPMFIVSRKDLLLDGKNPVLLAGYGGFNISVEPFFSTEVAAWLEMGGVFVLANIRGGGEYGEAWHSAGNLENKQNCFDDFISAAEWLISEKITSPSKLAIYGGSNGGLLVGACMIQRPELFGAVVPAVGVLDMLRYQKFTIGWAWVPEYGSSEKANQFAYLYKYSPLHNIQSGTAYPPTLILTGDHDDRVVPAHSFKFAATMQGAQEGESPILIRIETSAGHGAGKPISKVIDETADKLAFLIKQLQM